MLLLPLTYMNGSGQSVVAARDFFKMELEELIVVCDDFQLPVGRLRIREGGRSGGQKGLEDCIRRLGSTEFPRLRLGIGPIPPRWDVVDYVLGRFEPDQREDVNRMVTRGADAIEAWVSLGITEAANRFNGA